MAISEKLNTALTKFCASWNRHAIRSESELAADVRLTGYLVAVPFFGLFNLASSPAFQLGTISGLSIFMASVAVSFLLVAALASYKGGQTRRLISIALGPFALAVMTQGQANTLAIACLILGLSTFEARRGQFKNQDLAIGAVLVITLGSVFLAVHQQATFHLAGFMYGAPAIVAGLAFVALNHVPRSKVEEKRNSSAYELASLFVADTQTILVQTDRTARVSSVTSNLYDVLELENSEVHGARFLDTVHIADKVVLLSNLDAVASGKTVESFTIRLQGGNAAHGDLKPWIEMSCLPIAFDGEIILKLQTKTAINDKDKHAETKTHLSTLAIVSHELRTPLNAIIGFSDLMGKGLAGDIANDRQREYLSLIKQSGAHLLELVNTILDLSKLGNGTYELEAKEFLPDEAAAFAISMLATQAHEKKLGLDYFPECGLDAFSGDKRVCQQIIINLLSNAVKFTSPSGHIGLRLHLEDDRLIIEVEDTGRGMSQDELSKIGTPFFQAGTHYGRQHEGAGLGLSLVKQMARLHGGALEIESSIGKGTKVRVALAKVYQTDNTVSYFQPKEADESVRLIQLIEEGDHGPLRKTA